MIDNVIPNLGAYETKIIVHKTVHCSVCHKQHVVVLITHVVIMYKGICCEKVMDNIWDISKIIFKHQNTNSMNY